MKAKRLIQFSSGIMLIIALPMIVFTFEMVYIVSPYGMPSDGLASLGMLIGAFGYIFSLLVAITGLSFANKPYKYKWCRGVAKIQVLILVITLGLTRVYFFITMLPLTLLMIPYIIGAKKENEGDYYA